MKKKNVLSLILNTIYIYIYNYIKIIWISLIIDQIRFRRDLLLLSVDNQFTRFLNKYNSLKIVIDSPLDLIDFFHRILKQFKCIIK